MGWRSEKHDSVRHLLRRILPTERHEAPNDLAVRSSPLVAVGYAGVGDSVLVEAKEVSIVCDQYAVLGRREFELGRVRGSVEFGSVRGGYVEPMFS